TTPIGTIPVQFAKRVFHKGEELIVWVDVKWLKGQGFEVTMERKSMVDGGQWEDVAVVDAEPAEAKGGDGTGGTAGSDPTGHAGTGGTGSNENENDGPGGGGTGTGTAATGPTGTGGTGPGGT